MKLACRFRLIILALVPSLSPLLAHALKVPKVTVDWLHVPQTGINFAIAIMVYKCEFLEKFFRSEDANAANLLRFLTRTSRGALGTGKCLEGFNGLHLPLLPGEYMGHQGYRAEYVVTMVRRPLQRVASGFVEHMEGCESGKGKEHDWRGELIETCELLSHDEDRADSKKFRTAERLVLRYGRCVTGCTGRMITGEACGHSASEPESEKALASRIDRAKAKMDRFAFVGLAERWSESVCLFERMFPRDGRRKYPDLVVNFKFRSADTCAPLVEKVLRRHKFQDAVDEAIYDYAIQLFEKALWHNPSCKGDERRLSSELPPILL